MRIERLRVVAFATAAFGFVAAAQGAVRFDPATGYFPSGYSRPTSSFDTTVPPLAADGSALELGLTQPCPHTDVQSIISAIGPLAGSTLQRSPPVVPYFEDAMMASVPGTAEPTVVAFGSRSRGGFISSGIEVYAGWPPTARARFDGPIDASPPGEIAVTRYVDPHDLDFAFVGTSTVWLIRVAGNTASVRWTAPLPNGRSIAFVPAAGPTPALVVAVSESATEVFDASSGETLWRDNESGGEKVVAGTLGVADTPAFVVADKYGAHGVKAYAANPATLLWSRADLEADGVLLDDLSGDGHSEVMVGTARGVVQRLDAAGANAGAPLTLPGATLDPSYSVAFAKAMFAGASARYLITTDSTNDGMPRANYVYPLNLTAPIATESSQRGVCNAVGVADVDGDGTDEIVTTGELPGYDGTGWPSTLRVASVESGAEKWIETLPGTPPTGDVDMYVDFDIGNLGHGTDRDIVLAGPNGSASAGVVAVVDGATRALERRVMPSMPGANHVTAVRIVPGAVPANELLVVGSDFVSTTLHVLDASTLQTLFSSGPLAGAPDLGSVAMATFAGDASAHAIFTVPLQGVYSWNVGTHAIDYSIAASASIGALLPPLDGITRFAFVDGQRNIRIIDAKTGTPLDSIPIANEVLRLAGDPNDPQRLVIEDADGLATLRLDTHELEARSVRLPLPPYYTSTSLVVRGQGGESIVYAGTAAGVYAFHLTPLAARIFADGFDPQ